MNKDYEQVVRMCGDVLVTCNTGGLGASVIRKTTGGAMGEITGLADESLTAQGLGRLNNWAAWATKGECAMVLRHFYPQRAAACGNYTSTEIYDDPDDLIRIEINETDALAVDKALCRLADHLRNAVKNRYFGRPKFINLDKETLDNWVCQAARELMSV